MTCAPLSEASEHHIQIGSRIQSLRREYFTSSENFFLTETLTALLDAHSRQLGAATALIDRGKPLSFAQLADESRRVASGLRKLGIGQGDRVALWLPNVPAWLAAFFACAQLGAIAVSVNTRFRSHELADILQRSGARVLFYWPEFKGIDFEGILADCDPAALAALEARVAYGETGKEAGGAKLSRGVLSYSVLAEGEPLLASAAAPESGCAIFTTSGTTKAPKFVLHDQRTVLRHALDVVRGFSIDARSTLLLAPPLCGVFGFCTAMAALAAGRPLVMAPSWDPAQAVRDLTTHRITHANGTDEAFARMVDDPAADFSNVRFFGFAAFNPSDADLVQRAEARGLRLTGLYGTSEIQALFARQDERLPAAGRSLAGGRPVSAEARVRARDPESGVLLPHGAAGELEFYSPRSRMVEYLGNQAATAEAIDAAGYYRSGDLGHTTGDGGFVFLARMGDALRLGGFLVSPAEIEDVVQTAPGIAACQTVAVPGRGGLVPVSFVILQQGAAFNEAAVLAHVAGRLAKFKVPARVVPLDAFPVTPGANATKIQKGKLRELAKALLH
jgi:fatty-acyl-CoA synthase